MDNIHINISYKFSKYVIYNVSYKFGCKTSNQRLKIYYCDIFLN